MVTSNFDDLYTSEVFDSQGKKIGRVGQVYLDDKTGEPTWITVRTGLFGSRENFVPLRQTTLNPGRVNVPFSTAKVKESPVIDADRHLDAHEEAQLYRYYTAEDPDGAEDDEIAVKPRTTGPVATAGPPPTGQVPAVPSTQVTDLADGAKPHTDQSAELAGPAPAAASAEPTPEPVAVVPITPVTDLANEPRP